MILSLMSFLIFLGLMLVGMVILIVMVGIFFYLGILIWGDF